jgi:hypothetical protein
MPDWTLDFNWDITNSKDILAGNNYTHDASDYRIENTTNKLYTYGINFTLPMNLAGVIPAANSTRRKAQDQ